MRHIIIYIAAAILWASPALAQKQTMREYLNSTADGELLSYLKHNDVLDCIDYFEAGINDGARTSLNSKVTLKSLTEKYAEFAIGNNMTLQMRLLPADTTQVVACVYTVRTDSIYRSRIKFSNESASWRKPDFAEYKILPEVKAYHIIIDKDEDKLTVSLSNTMVTKEEKKEFEEQKLQKTLTWNAISQVFE